MMRTAPVIYSEAAEKAVLGCLLTWPEESGDKIEKALKAVDFFVPAHQEIYRAVIALWARGERIELMPVHLELERRGVAVQVGSPGIVAELTAEAVSHLSVSGCVKIVRDKALLREMAQWCVEMTQAIADGSDAESVVARASQRLEGITTQMARESTPWDVVDLADFIVDQDRRDHPVQIVESFIEKGTKVIFGGASKSKKTWSMLDLGMSVAFGKSFWGMRTNQVKVLHIDFELKPKKLAERVKAIAQAKGIEIVPGWLYPLSLRGQMTNPRQVLHQIRAKALEIGAGLITIDPAYKFIAGADENSAGDVAELMNHIEALVVETDAAVIIANHFSKGTQAAKDPMDRIAGSGVWARDADTLFVMTAHEEEGCLTVSPVLRNFAEIPEFVVRWNFPLMELADGLDPALLKQPKPHNAGQAEIRSRAMGELLKEMSMTYSEWMKIAEMNLGIKKDAFKKYFKLLKEAGRIDEFQGKWRLVI